jgi:hypothetical protein
LQLVCGFDQALELGRFQVLPTRSQPGNGTGAGHQPAEGVFIEGVSSLRYA